VGSSAPGEGPLASPSNGQGTASLVLGTVGLLLVWVAVLSPVLGILAITFGALGYRKSRRGTATNGGAALGGLGLGVVTMLGFVFFVWLGTS